MKKAPTLTIGIPCRNEAAFVGECLASLVSQDIETSFRVVVSDNNSQDESASIVERVISKNDNPRCELTLIRNNKDLSAGENFKRVFDYAESTPFFMWLGAHDALSTNFVREGTQLMESDEGCGMASGNPYSIAPLPTRDQFSSPQLMVGAIYDYSQEDPFHRYLLSAIKTGNCTIFHSIFRRKALSGYSWREAPSADHIMISRLLWSGKLRYFNGGYIRRYFKRDVSQRKKAAGYYEKNSEFFDAYVSDFYRLIAEKHSQFLATTYSKVLFDILLDRYGFPPDAAWPRAFGTAFGARSARLFVLSIGKSDVVKANGMDFSQGELLKQCMELSQSPNWLATYLRYVLMRLKKALAARAH